MLNRLEDYHDLFASLWAVGEPVFTDNSSVPTARVIKYKDSENISLQINKSYWESLDDYTRTFLISHEMLHVYLKHLVFGKEDDIPVLTNIAMDISINHMLCNSFGFTKELLCNFEELCWVDKFFPGEQIDNNLSWRTYYNLLLEKLGIDPQGMPTYILLGNHGEGEGTGESSDQGQGKQEEDPEGLEDIINGIMGDCFETDPTDIESFSQQAGTTAGNLAITVKVEVKKKRKWETVISDFVRRAVKETTNEQWSRKARRNNLLTGDLFLPSDQEVEEYDKDKIELWFYQDTSGSCYSLAERFFKAARSIPEDKFIIRTFCFDTRVYDVDLKTGKLFGFGGTYFHILEQHVQQKIKEYKVSYPKAIFVVTDGYGSAIKPEKPKAWHWFLSTNETYCIDKGCFIHYLKDFE